LEHRHEELEAAGPMADKEHHTDKVEDPHENRRHVEKLKDVIIKKRHEEDIQSTPTQPPPPYTHIYIHTRQYIVSIFTLPYK